MFSLTTVNRGTSRSCSWDLREESSAASSSEGVIKSRCQCSFFNSYNTSRTFHTSLHNNHPGRRTTMITAPVFSHRVFALCLSWTEKHSAFEVTVCVNPTSVDDCCLFASDSLPPVVFNSAFSRTSCLAHSGLV